MSLATKRECTHWRYIKVFTEDKNDINVYMLDERGRLVNKFSRNRKRTLTNWHQPRTESVVAATSETEPPQPVFVRAVAAASPEEKKTKEKKKTEQIVSLSRDYTVLISQPPDNFAV